MADFHVKIKYFTFPTSDISFCSIAHEERYNEEE